MSVPAGNDPFSGTNTKNILQHILSPKVVDTGSGAHAVKLDMINIDNVYASGNFYVNGTPINTSPPVPSVTVAIPLTTQLTSLAVSGGSVDVSTSISLTAGKFYSVSGYLTIQYTDAAIPFTGSDLHILLRSVSTTNRTVLSSSTLTTTPTTVAGEKRILISGMIRGGTPTSNLELTLTLSGPEAAYASGIVCGFTYLTVLQVA
jgi:hypothetical protein